MPEPVDGFLDLILRECASASPNPWYPSDYVRATGASRESLDPDLDRLRMAGIIRLTEWTQGKGQGYTLTEDGQRALQNPRLLALVRSNRWATLAKAPRAQRDPYQPDHGTPSRGEKVHAALDNTSSAFVTFTLIAANLAVFVVGLYLTLGAAVPLNSYLAGGVLGGGINAKVIEIQHSLGAVKGVDLTHGDWIQWLRLLRNCFVHFGLIHLGVNMYSLYAIGPFLEHIWGRTRFLLLYLLSGFAGSCALVISNPTISGAGASGAIWGILASLPVWIALNRRYISHSWASGMMRQLLFLFILNAGISLAPGISAAAHFGGGAAGAVAALLLNEERFGSGVGRLLSGVGLLAIPIVCLVVVVRAQTTDPHWAKRSLQIVEIAQVNQSVRDAADFYSNEIVPLLRIGPGTLNDAARASLVSQIDEHLALLNGSAEFLDSIDPKSVNKPEVLPRYQAEIEKLSHILQLVRKCLNEDANCSQDQMDAIIKLGNQSGLLREVRQEDRAPGR